MPITRFPDPRSASPEGVVAVGGDLHPDSLMLAYRNGIFPWPVGDYPLVWFSPEIRGVLQLANLHVPQRLARLRRNTRLRLGFDGDFDGVIRACARVHSSRDEAGTWILPTIIDAYCELHRAGHAHSVEAWDGDRLVGGLYGVDVDGAFAAESMFYTEPGASKLALLHLLDHLSSRGLEWIDIQVMTPHMERFGATPLPRDSFLELLAATRARGLRLFR
ncbi:MAG: leucyl/phenylalanyl-tRNA--protein transferase [Acidobacteria bacterium]|nr:leucyl/phenylalanyl-tRNA--protein transferase [Acidobacteriota bacterium]